MPNAPEAWIVIKIDPPRPECGHSRHSLAAICRGEEGLTAEEVAARICAGLDNRYIIGPVPYNTFFPDTPATQWPGSYRPNTSEPLAEDSGPIPVDFEDGPAQLTKPTEQS
jgi:hypothetical protein